MASNSVEFTNPEPSVAAPNSRLAYSIQDVVRLSGLGRSRVYEEIRDGRLRARKCGSRTMILHEDTVAWLRELPEVRATASAQKRGL